MRQMINEPFHTTVHPPGSQVRWSRRTRRGARAGSRESLHCSAAAQQNINEESTHSSSGTSRRHPRCTYRLLTSCAKPYCVPQRKGGREGARRVMGRDRWRKTARADRLLRCSEDTKSLMSGAPGKHRVFQQEKHVFRRCRIIKEPSNDVQPPWRQRAERRIHALIKHQT